LVTEAHRCEQLAQGCYAAFVRSRIRTNDLLTASPTLNIVFGDVTGVFGMPASSVYAWCPKPFLAWRWCVWKWLLACWCKLKC